MPSLVPNRFWKSVAAATATLLVSGTAFASPSAGGFTVRPAHFDPADPATRAYFKPVLAAGGTMTDQVIVGNTSDQPISFVVSAVDGLTGQTSGSVFANRQDPVAKAGSWVTIAVPTVTVAPHREVPVQFMVQVPPGAPAGDHLAGVAFENADPQTSGGGFQIKEVIRAVIGVQIRVPGPATFHAHVDAVRVEFLPGPGVAAVIVTLGDDGLALGKPTLTVSIAGPAGYQRTVTRALDTLLPGDIIDYPFAWVDDLGPGHYDITATLIGGGSTATLRGSSDLSSALNGTGSTPAAPAPAPVRRRSSAGGIGWWVLVMTAVGGVLGGVVLSRRRPRPTPPATTKLPPPKHPPTDQSSDEKVPVGTR